MANTYTQIHLQCVFCPKYRMALISKDWSERLHQYITGIVQNRGHKLLAINTMPDHLHMLFGFRTTESIADLMQAVKKDSSDWINQQKFTARVFHWQDGYGAFSYEKKRVPGLINYILNQEEHHKKISRREEYIELLKEFEVEFDERYIFKDPE